jgi:glutamine synthetase
MSASRFEEFLSSNSIDEVECLVPDITGTARGKILPASKLFKGSKSRGLRIPEDVFILTVTGAFSWKTDATDDA